MKRRKIIQTATTAVITGLTTAWFSQAQTYQAQTTSSVTIKWLGHSCFLFTGQGLKILVNPFKDLGCNAKYSLPKPEADLVLISSFLLDEGFTEGLPGNPRILSEPGDYEVKGLKIRGITLAHDREKGRRFGMNIAWSWSQGGIKIVHLGGAAAPIQLEQKILMGSPDIALIPVGGGAKAYNAQEALQAMQTLNPRLVIPTQYLTNAAGVGACDITGLQDWLNLVKDKAITTLTTNETTITTANLPKQGTSVMVFSNSSLLKS